jgi:hypothetical protein
MKKMKTIKRNLFGLLLFMCIGYASTSCNDDFLDKPVSSDVTIDTIFSARLKAESFLWNTYSDIIPNGFTLREWDNYSQMACSMSSQICDEGKTQIGWSGAYPISLNGMSADGEREDNFYKNYSGIRKAFIFIENIDRVTDIPDEEKAQLKAEAKVMIALRYSEMLKRYGGVPLVKKSLTVSDNIKIPRSSIEETVNYIIELCDESALVLPDDYPSEFRGRIHKGVALAVKARTLLMAARPLFNSPSPYLASSNPELVCYGNYDVERWRLAAEANDAVLDWANQSGWCQLINTGNPFADYTTATSIKDNAEVLLASKELATDWNKNGFWSWYVPFTWQGGVRLNYNILTKFRDADGNDVAWPTPDPSNSSLDVEPFTEYTSKMNNMEARWKASAWVVGQRPYNNTQAYDWGFADDGQNQTGVARSTKFISNYTWGTNRDWIVFRLSEFFLNGAEAWNEYQANATKAYDLLNEIRTRGGLSEVTSSDANYNTKETLRALIQRERAVELLCEEHRLFDVRQWKIAPQNGVIGGDFYGFRYTQNSAKNGYNDYHTFMYEKRYWADNQYLYPFPKAEVNKGYLIQNPGY